MAGSGGKREGYLRQLFEAHGASLRRFIAARFPGDAEVEDVAQEAWVRMHRVQHPERLENARAFLFQTAANLAIDHLRRIDFERRHFDGDGAAAEEPGDLQSPERNVDADQQLRIVETAIRELPPRCRQAFMMHRTRDMTYPEIARALNVSTSMVEKYVIQALKHCRQRLEAGNRALSAREPGARRR